MVGRLAFASYLNHVAVISKEVGASVKEGVSGPQLTDKKGVAHRLLRFTWLGSST